MERFTGYVVFRRHGTNPDWPLRRDIHDEMVALVRFVPGPGQYLGTDETQ